MVTAIGVDIVETARVERLVRVYGDRFINRILGSREKEILDRRQDRVQYLAGRFACKEAIIKALGNYLVDRPAYSQIEIVSGPNGIPQTVFSREVNDRVGTARTLVSISHEKNHAVAMAVISEDV